MTLTTDPQRLRSLADDVARHLRLSLAKDRFTATRHDRFVSLAMAVRDRLVDQWIDTQQSYYDTDARRVYYLSLEFMTGRLLANALIMASCVEDELLGFVDVDDPMIGEDGQPRPELFVADGLHLNEMGYQCHRHFRVAAFNRRNTHVY